MRGFALDGYRETADPLSSGFELTRGTQRRLQNENPVHLRGERFDVTAALPAPDFLIGIEENMRSDFRLHVEVLDGFNRHQRLGNPPLHVVDTRPAHDIVFVFERHIGQCSQRPDGVVVTKQQLGWQALPPACRPGMEHSTAAVTRNSFDTIIQAFETSGDDFADFMLRARNI